MAKKKTTIAPDIQKFLNAAKSAWNKSRKEAKKDADSQGSAIDDGTWNAQIIGASFMKSNAGSPMIKWEYRIAGGHLKGKKVINFDMLDREKSLYYLALKFIRLGKDPGFIEIDDIPENIQEIAEEKPYVSITTKTAAGQTLPNIYVNKILDDYDEEDEDDDDMDEDDDDDDDTDDDEDDDDDEEENDVSVGDTVLYNGKKHTVKKVNEKTGKITLENKKGVSVVIDIDELDE